MTTFQDPPLQSRRAVRQGDRVDPPFAPPQTPRTAAGAGEPLSYVTQNRPPLPGYGTPPSHGRRSSAPEPQGGPAAQIPAATPAATPAAQTPPTFRPRDYSPESGTAPPVWAPEYGDGAVEGRAPGLEPTGPHTGPSLASSLGSESSEQTLTRRELRAMRDHSGIDAAPGDEAQMAPQPVDFAQPAPAPAPAPPPQFVMPAPPFAAPAPAPSRQLDSARAEFDALAGRSAESQPPTRRSRRRAVPDADAVPEDGLGAFDALFAPPAPEAPSATPTADEHAVAGPPQPVEPPTPAQFPEPTPAQFQQPVPAQFPQSAPVADPPPAPVPPAPGEYWQAPPAATPTVAISPVAIPPVATSSVLTPPAEPTVSPTTGERPVGHWTMQSDIDDRTQINESTISRRVGSGGAITTSALVLPSIPGQDMTTGEFMLTDSISVSSAIVAESDIDYVLDPGDHQLVNTDSVPISAIRAVSSHTGGSHAITTTNPTTGNRGLTALIASASGMVVVVVSLLIVAITTGAI